MRSPCHRDIASYFKPPEKKRKRGRPKKRKRSKKPSLKEQAEQVQKLPNKKKQTFIYKDIAYNELEAGAEGAVQKELLRPKPTRINWDVEPYRALRKRLADSWTNKNDLYNGKDSFHKFCIHNGIARNVLKRFMQREEASPLKRGRRTLLSKDCMRHLCEGMFFVLCLQRCFSTPPCLLC